MTALAFIAILASAAVGFLSGFGFGWRAALIRMTALTAFSTKGAS